MFSSLFKARCAAIAAKTSYHEMIGDIVDRRAILRKDVLMATMEETIAEYKFISDILNMYPSRPLIFETVLEILAENHELAKRYKDNFLRRIIEKKDVAMFLRLISELELSESDILILSEADEQVVDAKTIREYKLIPLLTRMDNGNLRKFFQISSENKQLRRFIDKNFEIVIELITRYTGDYSVIFGCIIDFFPEYISKVIRYILVGRRNAGYKSTLELYALQFAADARYLLSDAQYSMLHDFIVSNVWTILDKISIATVVEVHKAVWILKNEFDVSYDEIHEFMECLYVGEEYEIDAADVDVDADVIPLIGDYGDNLGILDSYLMTAEGYEIVERNCYKLVAAFPEYVATISNIFPNADSEFMFMIAKEPDNELLRKFM